MARVDEKLWVIMGWRVTGDCGPYTFYTTHKRGRIVAFARAPALNPASPQQTIQRQKFIDAAEAWHGLTPESRAAWEAITKASSARMTGYDLFTMNELVDITTGLKTLERQTGIDLGV